MDNFVLAGKAKTVFRLLELKLRYETAGKQAAQDRGASDNGKKPE